MVSGVASELPPHIGLHVENVGLISLPLVDYQALDLIKKANKKSFNQNQNLHTFSTSNFELKNSEWNRQLEILAKRAATQLGYSNEKVGVIIEHMCLYEKGAQLAKCAHSFMNRNNSFARLVIQLPSVYTGGDYEVYKSSGEKQKRKADLGQKSKKAPYAMHFVAHMIESHFEMTEFTNGYCLVLICTLWSDGESVQRLMSKSESLEKLRNNFQAIANLEKPIAIMLENQYSHKTLEGEQGFKVVIRNLFFYIFQDFRF